MIAVPTANAMLLASPDLSGVGHFPSAFFTAIASHNYAMTRGTEPPTSPIMVYMGGKDWIPCPLFAYGSAAKALVHPEFRDDKYVDHAFPCIYTGPALCRVGLARVH